MVRKPHLIAGLLTTGALTLGLSGASQAAPLSALTISSSTILDRAAIQPGPGNGTFEGTTDGTFEASGAITDSGADHTQLIFSGVDAPDSDVVHGSTTFAGTSGSITVQWQGLHLPFENPVFDATWTLSSASGAYDDLHGTGTVVFTIIGENSATPVIDEAWYGSLH